MRSQHFMLAVLVRGAYWMVMVVFLNGEFVPEEQAMIPVSDRGFLYGDGLFETARVFNGRPFRLAQHLERMSRGADFLRIKLPHSARELQLFAQQLIQQNQMSDAVLRVAVSRGPGERGYTPQPGGTPTVVMSLSPAPPLDLQRPTEWHLITSSHRLPSSDALASFKTSNKLLQVAARIEAAEKGVDEALLLNTNGEVAEAAAANLFWIYHEKVCTVPTGRGVLPGITRAVVLEICQNLGLATNKRVIKAEALRQGEGIFLTQSAHGIIVVTEFNGERVGQSPLVERIHQMYCEMLATE